MALAIAPALPHAGIAPPISIAVPVTAVALTVVFAVPGRQRRAVRPVPASRYGIPAERAGGGLRRSRRCSTDSARVNRTTTKTDQDTNTEIAWRTGGCRSRFTWYDVDSIFDLSHFVGCTRPFVDQIRNVEQSGEK